MATINPTIAFNLPITRQTLFDMWAEGELGSISVDNFADGFIPIQTASSFSDAPPSPDPGQLFWHEGNQLMYCWHDEIDNTAVSLWLAIGPDCMEVAMLTEEPIGSCMPVDVSIDRRCVLASPTRNYPSGVNHSGFNSYAAASEIGETAASGSWIRVGVDGICFGTIVESETHPSPAHAEWTNKSYIGMDLVPGRQGSLINAGLSGNENAPYPDPIGLSIASFSGSSEPATVERFIFAPRSIRLHFPAARAT